MVDFGIPGLSSWEGEFQADRAPLKTAVIGAGYWGKKVIREVLEISRRTRSVVLESVVDSSPMALASCRRDFPELDYRSDYRSLLKNDEISAVHICTPNATHYPLASDFLQANKHVLVEKPLALTTRDAYELVHMAREDNRVLSTGHLLRFNNGIRTLKDVLASRVIGEPFYIRVAWTGPLPPQRERDVITDLAPHPIDLVNNILCEWPNRVTCNGKRFREAAVGEEVAFIISEHLNGVTVSMEVSWLDPEKRRDVTVVGSMGTTHLDCLEQSLTVKTDDSTYMVPTVPSNTLEEELTHFLKCVRQNELSLPVENQADGVLGAETVRVLSACKASRELGRTVALDPLSKEIFAR